MFFNGMADEVFTDIKDYWIGGSLTSDSGWAWTDGTNLSFTNWDKGQPSNTAGQYCIAQQIDNGKWYSYACNETRPYICRVPPYTGPQCPDGWTYVQFTKKCYYLTTTKRNWSNSSFYCDGFGGTLVSIHSPQENMVVSAVAYYYAQSSLSFWIGMYNPSFSGNWEWSDGSQVDYTYWNGQPSNTYQFAYTQTNANNAYYWYPANEYDYAAMCQKPANVI